MPVSSQESVLPSNNNFCGGGCSSCLSCPLSRYVMLFLLLLSQYYFLGGSHVDSNYLGNIFLSIIQWDKQTIAIGTAYSTIEIGTGYSTVELELVIQQ